MGISMLEKIDNDVEPSPVQENLYVSVYQDSRINNLGFITPGQIRGVDIASNLDKKSGKFVIEQNSYYYYFDPSHVSIQGRTQQLLMLYIEHFKRKVPPRASVETILQNKNVKINIVDIARNFNLTPKQARVMVIDSSIAMQLMVIGWYEGDGKSKSFVTTNILQGIRYKQKNSPQPDLRRGEIEVTFADSFAKMLPHLYSLWYPKNIRKIPVRRYPNANAFALKLALENKMHPGRPVSVQSLLNSTQDIPAYETIMVGAGQVYKRIITPFLRDMTILLSVNILTDWQLSYKGKIIPREEYVTLTYAVFNDCYVVFVMPENPQMKKMRLAQIQKIPEKTMAG